MSSEHNEETDNREHLLSEEESSSLNTSGIKKGRKTIKNKIQFQLTLNEEQKRIKADALRDDISW
jgi:hypothetical protein